MIRLMMAAAVTVCLAFPGAGSAQSGYSYPGYTQPDPYYHPQHHPRVHREVNCHELRSACMHKRELGEQGEGNCARYRELCRR